MKIYVIDRDPMSAQFIKSKLEPLGHKIEGETSKSDAVNYCQDHEHDLIFIDPSPLTTPRTLVLDIRRSTPYYPYTLLMTQSPMSSEEALKFGVNDVFAKPIDPVVLDRKVENAAYFISLLKRMGDDSEDFPSAGGVIAKSAFNQLFLSSVDRADRYGEETYMLLISMSNYKDIYANEGPYAADYAVAKLSQYLVSLRRQSDIIGQTAVNEYSLLLQRPVYENEPVEAAGRFAEALSRYEGFKELDASRIEINVTLASIPSGDRRVNNTFECLMDV